MKRKLRIRPEAETDIVEARNWYRLQAEGLSAEFLNAVDDCLIAVESEPLAYPMIYGQVRRALLRRFPYAVLYLVEAKTEGEQPTEIITVLACFHARRDPTAWQSRVG